MADVAPIHRTESLANPFRPGNGVPPPLLAGRDGLLAECERFLCSQLPTTPTVARADHQALEPALLHELDLAFFEDRDEVAGPTGQRVLDAMARHGGRVTALEIRRALPDVQNVDQVVARLLERGLVDRPSRGRHDVTLPLFRADLRQRADLTHRSRAR